MTVVAPATMSTAMRSAVNTRRHCDGRDRVGQRDDAPPRAEVAGSQAKYRA